MMRATKIPKRWQISWWVSIRNHTFIIPWWKSLFGNKKISCKHLIILKAPTLSVLVSFPGTFLLCAILEGWDEHFPPDKFPAPPKKWRLFHSTKRMAKTQGSRPWVHFLMLSFWPWFPGPWNWRIRTRVGCYEKCHAHVEMRQGCGIVWGEGMLRQRNRPQQKLPDMSGFVGCAFFD